MCCCSTARSTCAGGKLLLPPFHGERMQAYRASMLHATRGELDRWQMGRPRGALQHMQPIIFEVIMRAVFGLDEADRLGPLATRCAPCSTELRAGRRSCALACARRMADRSPAVSADGRGG